MAKEPTLENMTTRSAGAYLRVLRESNGYTQSEIADQLGVVEATVRRWEKGTHRLTANSLSFYSKLVGGNGDDALELFTSSDATEEDAKRLAYQWVRYRQKEQQMRDRIVAISDEQAHDLSEEDLKIILRVVRQTAVLQRDPGVLHILSDLFSSLADLVKPDRNP